MSRSRRGQSIISATQNLRFRKHALYTKMPEAPSIMKTSYFSICMVLLMATSALANVSVKQSK